MKPTLLVLAAGMGSRYGGLKQMEPVGPNGETILDFTVQDAVKAGFGRVVFVIRPDFDADFRRKLGARFETMTSVDYCHQELKDVPAWFGAPAERSKPWGTGHAVLAARGLIREPFAMVNADDFYGQESYAIMARALEAARDTDRADYCMVGYALGSTLSEHGTVSRGICRLNGERLEAVVETANLEKTPEGARDRAGGGFFNGDEIVSMNFFGFTPSIFGHLEAAFEAFLKERGADPKAEFYVPAVVDALIRDGKANVRVLRSRDAWFGITYREDRDSVAANIRQLVDAGRYPRPPRT